MLKLWPSVSQLCLACIPSVVATLLCHLVTLVPPLFEYNGVLGDSSSSEQLPVCFTADIPVLGLLQVAWLSL